jgi:hypothetical protein
MIFGLEGFKNEALKAATIKYVDSIISFFPKIKERLFYFGFQNEIKDDCINTLVKNGNTWDETKVKNADIAYYDLENGLNGGTENKDNEIACTIRLTGKANDVVVLREKAFQDLGIKTMKDKVLTNKNTNFFHSGLQQTTLEHILAHELGHVILDDYFTSYGINPFLLTREGKKIKYDAKSEANLEALKQINNPVMEEADRKELTKFRAACILAFYSMSKGNNECGLYSKLSLLNKGSLEEWMAETISAYFTGGAMDNYMKTFICLLFQKDKNNC